MSEKKEECGMVGIYSKRGKDVAPLLYNALVALQHRGQDAAGVAILSSSGKIEERKGLGLVREIFKEEDTKIEGRIGIGHTRYPTTGRCELCDVQPSVYGGIAVSHNGHIANYKDIKKRLTSIGRNYMSTVDSEPIAMLLDEKRGEGPEQMVMHVMKSLDGAYSDSAIFESKLLVFRDPHAVRPLVWGEDEDFVIFASETTALDINGIPYKGVVEGGELVIVDNKGMKRKSLMKKEPKHCMFEYVYFSRPDSVINGLPVYEVREKLGKILAKEHPIKKSEADVVIPVPDTSRTAALVFANELGIPFEEGLIKNRYIGRTFIMPNQLARSEAVRLKLNPVRKVIEGKRIVLVDDSIVRGTTLREIVKMVREAGAKEVHLRITCPPIRDPCFYGVDMSTYSELIANEKSVEEIRKYLNADSLGFISIEGVKKAIGLPLCTGCLDQDYPTEIGKKMAKERKGAWSCG
jgi:amidophosphoribosyltransferase